MDGTFIQYRPYLFSIAYRMLGSVMDAEDMVQDAYLRWTKVDAGLIEQPKAFLAKIVTRLCIDHLRSAQVTRESYVGPWLPEPLATAAPDSESLVLIADTLSLAFLRLLERLTPNERAVYLLRHVFDYEYGEISEIVEKSEAACRQLFRRARQHLTSQEARFDTQWAEQEALVNAFWEACQQNDTESLRSILAEDVVMWSDGGGKVTAARKPVKSVEKVITFLFGIMRLAPPSYRVKFGVCNHQPAAQVWVDGQLISVMIVDVRHGRVQNIFTVLNPDKLRHLQVNGLNPR